MLSAAGAAVDQGGWLLHPPSFSCGHTGGCRLKSKQGFPELGVKGTRPGGARPCLTIPHLHVASPGPFPWRKMQGSAFREWGRYPQPPALSLQGPSAVNL
jgi:hypothetical protein